MRSWPRRTRDGAGATAADANRLRRPATLLGVVMSALVFSLAAVQSAVGIGAPGERGRLRASVLVGADIPTSFTFASSQFWMPSTLATQGTWSLSQLKAWGYVLGYEVQFDRPLESGAPAQISSNAAIYRTPLGASQSLRANANNCQTGGWSELSAPKRIGDAAHLCTVATTVRGNAARTFFVVWRRGRMKGSVTLTAEQGKAAAADALTLARVAATRMARAAR